jgi:hypothetical protein
VSKSSAGLAFFSFSLLSVWKTFLLAVSIFTLFFFYCICWFRSRLLFSCNFNELFWRLIIVCSFLYGILITPFSLKNVIGGCLILYTVGIVFYIVSFSLLYLQWNVNTSGKAGSQIPQLPLGDDSSPWGR